jgi:hypothetical protein
MRNRTVLKLFSFIAPLFTWIVSALIPGRKASVMATECRNKAKIMTLVQGLDSYMDPEGKTPLQTIVEKCYALGSFPALWAVEGAGKDLAEWHMARNSNPARLLTDAPLDPKWNKALLMLHAGLGLGFAKYVIERLPSSPSDEQVRQAVTRTVELCRSNSRPGYYGAAIESLGLVSRFMRNAAFCRRVHEVLTKTAPDSVSFFWRGVGRCLYFHPINFLPGFSRPSRAPGLCEAEAPRAELKDSLLSGMAWALTVVNMTNPEVMEWVLEHDADYFNGSPAFQNGVMSSVIMRYDTTPDDPLVKQFMSHQPNPQNRALCDLWKSRIQQTIETAIHTIYPALKKHNRLDEVFHYQSLANLAAQLEQEARPSVR